MPIPCNDESLITTFAGNCAQKTVAFVKRRTNWLVRSKLKTVQVYVVQVSFAWFYNSLMARLKLSNILIDD